MDFRLTPTLCMLLLAGCTSSEPEGIAPAPLAQGPAVLSETPPPSKPQNQTEQVMPEDTLAATTGQPGFNCRTVGNATLCDAPVDPSADDTLYTN